MRLTLLAKNALLPDQLRYLDERLAAPEHRDDKGPPRVWYIYQTHLYAFLETKLQLPIAISEASGRPIATPGWWIDKMFRGQGYGNELADLLAAHLAIDGVTDIGRILIDTHNGEYDERSGKLARRFRVRFVAARVAR